MLRKLPIDTLLIEASEMPWRYKKLALIPMLFSVVYCYFLNAYSASHPEKHLFHMDIKYIGEKGEEKVVVVHGVFL